MTAYTKLELGDPTSCMAFINAGRYNIMLISNKLFFFVISKSAVGGLDNDKQANKGGWPCEIGRHPGNDTRHTF